METPTDQFENQFWIAIERRQNLFQMITGVIKTIEYEMTSGEKAIHLHFGWPLSSWMDRLSIGIMIHNIIKLPRIFPDFVFHMDYQKIKKPSKA